MSRIVKLYQKIIDKLHRPSLAKNGLAGFIRRSGNMSLQSQLAQAQAEMLGAELSEYGLALEDKYNLLAASKLLFENGFVDWNKVAK